MAVYYYISASLPMLIGPDQPPPLDSGGFLDACRRFVNRSEYPSLENSTLDPDGPDAPGVCFRYRTWERSLRNDLAKLRAVEQQLDPSPYVREAEPVFGTLQVAVAAMNASTPLDAEILLDAARWSVIDNLATGHFFDIDFLRSYRLKLQILERRAMFDEERGFAAYRDIYARVLEASGGTH